MSTRRAPGAEKTEAEIEAEIAALDGGHDIAAGEPAPQLPEGFLPMDSCPMDGRAVRVTDAAFRVVLEATYRTTTQFVSRTGRWEKKQYWACRNTAGTKLPFEPAAWSPL